MTFAPQNSQNSFVPTNLIWPKTPEETEVILTDYLKRMAEAVNSRDIAQYNTTELVTGQQFFTPSNNNAFRFTFRVVVDFGQLPSSAIKSVAHNVAFDANTLLTRIYGVATDPNTRYIPIPYINVAAPADSVELDVDTANVNITTTTANYAGFTTCFVILEYLKA